MIGFSTINRFSAGRRVNRRLDRTGIDKKNKEAIAVCNCGLEQRLNYVPAFETVDYYNKFRDQCKK
jgi:transcription elongation factor Elf1